MSSTHLADLIVAAILRFLPLDVAPQGGHGFAGSVVVAFVALGLLIILAKWTSSKPRKPKK